MDTLILANLVMSFGALILTSRRFFTEREMKMFRLPAMFISAYIFSIYLLSVMGIIPESDIRQYMRWFQLVIAAYIMLETKHG